MLLRTVEDLWRRLETVDICWHRYFCRHCVALIVRCCHVMLPRSSRGLGSTVFATAIVVRTWDSCRAFLYLRNSRDILWHTRQCMQCMPCMLLFAGDVPSYYSLSVVSETFESDFFTSTVPKLYLLTSAKRPVGAKLHLLAAQRERPILSVFFCSGFMFDCLTYGNAFHYLVLVFLFASTHWVTHFEVEDFYTEVGAVLVVRAPVRSCCDRDCDRCDRYTCWVRYWVYSTDTVGNPEKSTLGWHTV